MPLPLHGEWGGSERRQSQRLHAVSPVQGRSRVSIIVGMSFQYLALRVDQIYGKLVKLRIDSAARVIGIESVSDDTDSEMSQRVQQDFVGLQLGWRSSPPSRVDKIKRKLSFPYFVRSRRLYSTRLTPGRNS